MHPSSTQCTHIRSQHQQFAPEAKGGGRANKNDEHTARSAEVTKLGGGQTIPRRTRGSCPAMPTASVVAKSYDLSRVDRFGPTWKSSRSLLGSDLVRIVLRCVQKSEREFKDYL